MEEAKIRHEGLFLNVDSGHDGRDFRSFLQKKGIVDNVEQNPRNEQEHQEVYFDEGLYKNCFKIE